MSTLADAPGQAAPSIASQDILLLVAKAQNYDWGRTGTNSEVRISDRLAHVLNKKIVLNCPNSPQIYCSYYIQTI
jgi:hypothetical protein